MIENVRSSLWAQFGLTPFMLACLSENIPLLEWLREHGVADIHYRDKVRKPL